MEFGLTGEQEKLRIAVSHLFHEEFPRERIREWDEKDEYPHQLYQEMARLGWLGLPFPVEYGGTGGNALDVAILLEELARRAAVAASIYLFSVVLGAEPVCRYGSEEQRQHYLPRVASGEMKLALAPAEPGSVATAVPHGDHYLLDGAGIISSGACVAQGIITIARVDQGLAMFLVDPEAAGVEVRRLRMAGMRATGAGEVSLHQVPVSKEAMLGASSLAQAFDVGRVAIAAVCVGNAQAVIDDAISHGRESARSSQAIQHTFAAMQTEVNAARLLTYKAAWLLSRDKHCSQQASIAKIHSSRSFVNTALQGMEILGGRSYTVDCDMQRYFRDAKFWAIAGGDSVAQKDVIAETLEL